MYASHTTTILSLLLRILSMLHAQSANSNADNDNRQITIHADNTAGSSSSPTGGSLTRAQRAAAQLALSAGAGLSLHLGRVQWLARDLVWVMPDSGCDAARCMQEWVDAYHGEVRADGPVMHS